MMRFLHFLRAATTTVLVGVSLLCLAQDFDVHYVVESGESYPLRYGQAEQNDQVTPQLSIGVPTCFQRGTDTKLQIIDPQNKVLQWKVVSFELEGIPHVIDASESYTYYWNHSTGFMTRTQLADLPAFPNHIEYCQVSAEFLIAVQAGGANRSAQGRSGKVVWKHYRLTDRGLVEFGDGGEQREQYATQKLYLVLDEPTAPMSPAWASLLKYPCSWASKDTVEIDAAKEVTFGVFWYPAGFYYPNDTNTKWVFGSTLHLKVLLDNFDGLVPGNCLDVSAFDVVCKNALGLHYKLRQLTSDPEAEETNPVCLIGSDASQYQYYAPLNEESEVFWAWHSVAVPGNASFSASTPIYSACEAH